MKYFKKIQICEDLSIIICAGVPIITHIIVNVFVVHALLRFSLFLIQLTVLRKHGRRNPSVYRCY